MSARHFFVAGVCVGPEPEPGDLIRVTRTETRPKRTVTSIYEGFFELAETRERANTGWSWINDIDNSCRMRLRDRGPLEFGDGATETDVIEVLEARSGAPYEHILVDVETVRNAQREEKRSAEIHRRKNRHWTRRLLRRLRTESSQ